jgi:hypothetical protein
VNIFSVEVDITAVGYGGWAITEVNSNKSGHECLFPSPKDSWHHMENQEDWFSTAGIDGFDGCNVDFGPYRLLQFDRIGSPGGSDALALWNVHYNYHRTHTACENQPPTSPPHGTSDLEHLARGR